MILTEEQQAIVDMARSFAESELKPNATAWEEAGYLPDDLVKKMGELGLMGMLVPEEWGGAGVDYGTYALVVEELAAGDASVSTMMSVHTSVVCLPILNFGTEAQKQRFLKPLSTGGMVGAFCLTEPGAGSDAAAIKCRAVKDGDSYVLNGSKQFISNGKRCGVALVIAVTDPAAGKKGISAFLVPQGTKGFEVARLENKLGQRASDTAQLVFQDCRIPADLRLGAEGEGLKIALANLEGGRIGIAAQAIGMARAALDEAVKYAKERKTFGKPIAEHQAIAFRLADMATQVEAARALTQHACAVRASGQRALKHAAMAKLFATEMAEKVCSDAIQIHGGYGFLKDFLVERLYRDVRVCKIYEGTSDIQKIIISRELMGGLGMGGAPIEFYFDFSSPYGYLASERIDKIAAEFGRTVDWHPILLGVIFKATGQSPLVSQNLRGPYHKRDMERSARKHGTKFALPDSFPFNSVYQCRIFYWLLQNDAAAAKAYGHAVFRAAFTQNRIVPEAEDAIALAVELGHDRAAVTAGMQDQAVKDRLRDETQQAMHKGVFGSPFIIVDGEPFWGNDRLAEVREWLQTGGW